MAPPVGAFTLALYGDTVAATTLPLGAAGGDRGRDKGV